MTAAARARHVRRSVSPPCSARRCLPSCSERRDQLAAGRGAGGFHIDSVVPWLLACTLCISLLNVALCDNNIRCFSVELSLSGALTLWSSPSPELLSARLSSGAASLSRSLALPLAGLLAARSLALRQRSCVLQQRARLRVWRIAQHAAARRSRAAGLGAQRRRVFRID